jgi:anthranilate 1,2-dioxygenase small subunit
MLEVKHPIATPAFTADIDLVRAVEAFNVAYCRVLDAGRLHEWPEFFTEDALYVVSARENFDANLPVGLVYCEGRGMMKDRALTILETAMFAPRYLRHFVTNVYAETVEGGEIVAGANYLLTQVLMDEPSATIHQVGAYFDRFVLGPDGLKLKERRCIYDNLLLDNSLVYPV